jgi:hypothetical protein
VYISSEHDPLHLATYVVGDDWKMTDELLPDPIEQAGTVLERALPKIAAQIEELVDSGGKKTVRYQCSACGAKDTVDVPVHDPDMLVKALSAGSAALQRIQAQKPDDASEAATKLLRDRSALSDEELAEYIARLEHELSRDAES